MKKVILVKKDPGKPAGADNWIVMNSYEFAMFMKTPEGQRRRRGFAMLYGCERDDVIIIAECGEENARQWKADINRADYLRTRNAKHGSLVYSFSELRPDHAGGYGWEELLADERGALEETVMENLAKERLRAAIRSLGAGERDLVEKMYLTEPPMTEEEYAESIGIKRHQANYRKRKVLEKLRLLLEE